MILIEASSFSMLKVDCRGDTSSGSLSGLEEKDEETNTKSLNYNLFCMFREG